MKSIAIIPARGGSKRIPRKNVKEFCGYPVIKYSIEAAINSGVFDEVMVSTDDHEIADIAMSYGAKVPFLRSDNASNDHATLAEVIKEVLRNYSNRNMSFEYFCLIFPAAPFVKPDRLCEFMNKLYNSKHDYILPVLKFSYPPQRSFSIEDELLTWNYPEHAMTRTQDMKFWYHDSGQYSAGRVKAFLDCTDYANRKFIPFVLSELEAQDIDTIEDWELAEIKYKIINKISW